MSKQTTGLHAGFEAADLDVLRTCCVKADLETKGSRETLVARLKKALPAAGWIALLRISNAENETVVAVGEPVPLDMLARSAWLYRRGAIGFATVTAAGEDEEE